MHRGRRVTEAVEKIEAGNGLESRPWKGGSRNSPDLDGGIATFAAGTLRRVHARHEVIGESSFSGGRVPFL